MSARRRTLPIVLGAALLAWFLLGCAAAEAGSGSNPGATTLRPGSDPEANADAALRYFEAVASNDPEAQADGLEYAAPDSPAAIYLRYLSDASAAFDESGPVRAEETASAAAGGYQVCAASTAVCRRYSDIVLADGRVNDFTVDGTRLGQNTALGRGKVEPLGGFGTVEFLSRNAGPGAFGINLRVTSGGIPVRLERAGITYVDAAGRHRRIVRFTGPDSLEPAADALVLLVFGRVPPGPGALRFVVSDGAGRAETVTLRTL